MSDYLWDKTGEPDAETERIENLLGQLRFQPTPFDPPAELPARSSAATRTRNVLSWPRLALAASLTLAVLAGAWLVLRQQTGTTNEKQQVVQQDKQTGTGENYSTTPALKVTEATNENNAGGEKKEDGTPAAAPSRGNETQHEQRAAAQRRPGLPDLANNRPRRLPRAVAPHGNRTESASASKRQKNMATPGVKPVRREETAALTEQEREAAEKVLYALRITSEKLNYARRQVQGTPRDEDNR
jgi:hypothetical protein